MGVTRAESKARKRGFAVGELYLIHLSESQPAGVEQDEKVPETGDLRNVDLGGGKQPGRWAPGLVSEPLQRRRDGSELGRGQGRAVMRALRAGGRYVGRWVRPGFVVGLCGCGPIATPPSCRSNGCRRRFRAIAVVWCIAAHRTAPMGTQSRARTATRNVLGRRRRPTLGSPRAGRGRRARAGHRQGRKRGVGGTALTPNGRAGLDWAAFLPPLFSFDELDTVGSARQDRSPTEVAGASFPVGEKGCGWNFARFDLP